MTPQATLFGDEVVASSTRFDMDAMGFLTAYVRKSRGQPFSSEDVTLAAIEAGIAPQDLRAWGSVFQQAARDGLIRRSDVLFKRSMGNNSLAPGWVAV